MRKYYIIETDVSLRLAKNRTVFYNHVFLADQSCVIRYNEPAYNRQHLLIEKDGLSVANGTKRAIFPSSIRKTELAWLRPKFIVVDLLSYCHSTKSTGRRHGVNQHFGVKREMHLRINGDNVVISVLCVHSIIVTLFTVPQKCCKLWNIRYVLATGDILHRSVNITVIVATK